MGEVGIERVRQANLAIRKLSKVAVRKDGGAEVGDQPVINIGAHGFNHIERQR